MRPIVAVHVVVASAGCAEQQAAEQDQKDVSLIDCYFHISCFFPLSGPQPHC